MTPAGLPPRRNSDFLGRTPMPAEQHLRPRQHFYDVLRLLIEILIVRGQGDAQLRAEVLALRHQLGVLERQAGRPR